MNSIVSEITKSITGKTSVDDCSVEELKQIASQYPYFGPAQFLYVKKLKSENSSQLENQKHKASLYFQNPVWLNYLLEENTTTIIENESISEEKEITVRAGRKYAAKFPGTMFAFDQQEWRVKPCSKVTFHFINEDQIRHQFMMHGLPKYLYKYGMFHLEVTGPKTVSGTIIVPGSDDTFLVHCDISHHMEKGMKAQLVVGKGGENIPSIPGLTPYNINDIYEAENLPMVSDKAEQSAVVRQITTAFTKSDTQNYLIILIGALVGLLSIPLIKKIMPSKKTEN